MSDMPRTPGAPPLVGVGLDVPLAIEVRSEIRHEARMGCSVATNASGCSMCAMRCSLDDMQRPAATPLPPGRWRAAPCGRDGPR